MGFTTPENFEPLVNGPLMRQGFFSRSLIFKEIETNPKWKPDFDSHRPLTDAIKNTLIALANNGVHPVVRIENYGQRSPVVVTKGAAALLDNVREQFWHDGEKAKEMALDSVYRRGFELTNKISMILGAPAGLVTEHDVKWAYALVKNDVDKKANVTASNIAMEDNRLDEAIIRRIIGLLGKQDEKTGLTTGTVVNRVQTKKISQESVMKGLKYLEEKGKIVGIDHNTNRAKTKKWFLA